MDGLLESRECFYLSALSLPDPAARRAAAGGPWAAAGPPRSMSAIPRPAAAGAGHVPELPAPLHCPTAAVPPWLDDDPADEEAPLATAPGAMAAGSCIAAVEGREAPAAEL